MLRSSIASAAASAAASSAADQNARRDAAGREVSQLQSRLSRLESELTDNNERLAGMQKDGGADGFSGANLFAAGAKEALAALEAARSEEQAVSAKRADAEGADQSAREALSDARQSLSKLTAEQAALERILSRGGSADWTPALDEMQAKAGYEQALAAALGEDLDAAIGGDATLRWTQADVPSQALPAGTTPLSELVSAPAALAARLSQIGVVESGDIKTLAGQLKTGQRLVTRDGQVARWDGFEIAAGAETSAAIKLKQQNRLAELTSGITGLEAGVEAASEKFEAARALRKSAEDAARTARKALPDLERRDRAAQAALAQYETDIARASAEKRSIEDRLERLGAEITEIKKQLNAALETQCNISE